MSAEIISRKDIAAAWLAGALDGEGCIMVRFKKDPTPERADRELLDIRVAINNTHPQFIAKTTAVLKALEVKFCASAWRPNQSTKNTLSRRNQVQIIVSGRGRVKKLLGFVLPHLSCKYEQAKLALAVIALREQLAEQYHGGGAANSRPRLRDNAELASLIEAIAKAKHDYPDILEFARQADTVFGNGSSETTR